MTPQLLLLLDANDSPVAVTASTSCAVSVPTTHNANRDGALLELINKKVGQGGQAALLVAIRRPKQTGLVYPGGCAPRE